jgi:hypothetical protein
MWDGYPFLLSAAIGDLDDEIVCTVKGYNVAGALQATQQSAGATFTDSVVDFRIDEIYGSLTGISYVTVYLESELGEILTNTITVDVKEACENPVYLIGRNSLGGVMSWLFDLNQEYSFDDADEVKRKRLVLNTEYLTINQWEALQDFNRLGQVYRNSIVEFTSSTIKTSTRIGQQLYVVDTDGDKIGVVSVPSRNATNTKQRKHIFDIEIEYPETFTA